MSETSLCCLPQPVLASILSCLGEAREVVRAATACQALWKAAAGPLHKVHTLKLRCSGPDLEPQLLASLLHRFPAIQQLHVAAGQWQWTGCRSLHAWAGSLTALHADNTSFPLALVCVQQRQQQGHKPAHAITHTAEGQESAQQTRSHPQQTHVQGESQSTENLHSSQGSPAPPLQQTQLQQDQPIAAAASTTPVPPALRNLVVLQLQGAVTSTVRCRVHGVSDCHCHDGCSLGILLQQNPSLQNLDLAGNTHLPHQLFSRAIQSASCSTLTSLTLSDCGSLANPGRALAECFPGLQRLDLGSTATADADVRHLAAGLTRLRQLSLRGCRRVSDEGIHALAAAPAVTTGSLTSLDLGALTRPSSAAFAKLTAAWVSGCRHADYHCTAAAAGSSSSSNSVQLHVGFGRTSHITDEVLGAFEDKQAAAAAVAGADAQGEEQALLLQQQMQGLSLHTPSRQGQQQQQQPPVISLSLCGLHLSGCQAVSGEMLLRLGECGALSALTSLDLSDTEAFRQPLNHQQQQQQLQQQHHPQQQLQLQEEVSARASSRSLLPQLLRRTGKHLQVLHLDGCFLDDAAAVALASASHGLTELRDLSLVGSRGVGNAGLRALLAGVPALRALSLGGSVSAWSEGHVLQDSPVLGSLTQLKLLRRPVLRDVELAAVLAAASSLRSLHLVGCYMLTDGAFELATAVDGCGGVDVAVPLQQLTQLCLTACDGIVGSSIARLKGLRHLRASFCASLSVSALQHVAVACTRLQLLEVPAQLSAQGLIDRAVKFSGPSGSRHVVAGGGVDRGAGKFVCRGSSTTNVQLVLPQQGGSGGSEHQHHHLQRLKLKWI